MKEKLTHQFALTKTITMKLEPVPETAEYIKNNGSIIESDAVWQANRALIKPILDNFYKAFIEEAMKRVCFKVEDIKEYKNVLEAKEKGNRKSTIIRKLHDTVTNAYNESDIFVDFKNPGELLRYLSEFCSEEEKEIVNRYNKNTQRLKTLNDNRLTLFGTTTGSVAYRLVNDNMQIYIKNENAFDKLLETEDEGLLANITTFIHDFSDIIGETTLEEFMALDNYNCFLSQKGISEYNTLISGRSLSLRIRQKGLNEIVNEYNQTVKKAQRLKKFKQLKKSIMSDTESASFTDKIIKDDITVLNVMDMAEDVIDSACKIREIFKESLYDPKQVFVNAKKLSEMSTLLYGNYSEIRNKRSERYDAEHASLNQTTKAYAEKKKKALKKDTKLSLKYIAEVMEEKDDFIPTSISSALDDRIEKCHSAFMIYRDVLKESKGVPLRTCSEIQVAIRNCLDAAKDVQKILSIFRIETKEEDIDIRDEAFYEALNNVWDLYEKISVEYNPVRNYLSTELPVSEKLPISFGYTNFLGGWAKSNIASKGGMLLKKGDEYYLGTLNINMGSPDRLFREIIDTPIMSDDTYELLDINSFPQPNNNMPRYAFPGKDNHYDTNSVQYREYGLTSEIEDIYRKGTYKENKEDLIVLIDYYKRVLKFREEQKTFGFIFKNSADYSNIDEFYSDIECQGTFLEYITIAGEVVDEAIRTNKLFLFRITNKDFSEYSHGNPNLFTIILRKLFSEENIAEHFVFPAGNASVELRKASIPYKVTHPKKTQVENKRIGSEKPYSVFDYDLVKNKRYTVDQFILHLPVKINIKLGPTNAKVFNTRVNNILKEEGKGYVIGIDRGERNLIYVSVIDPTGAIVEQKTLNIITSKYGDRSFNTDYHELIAGTGKTRKELQKDWNMSAKIKNVKNGFVSAAVKEVCDLILKYDAVVVMEDLNMGFTNSRAGIDLNVYKKFEAALINKLSHLILKDSAPGDPGSIENPYQLAPPFPGKWSSVGKQWGIIFYVDAWRTSITDPVTGFASEGAFAWKNMKKAKEIWEKIAITYEEDMFTFDVDFSDFTEIGGRTKWKIWSFGERIISKRNGMGFYEYLPVDITEAFKDLFVRHGIDYTNDLKTQILGNNSAAFHEELLRLFRLTMKLRNSSSKEDYIVSPVKGPDGKFFISSDKNKAYPVDADANGAYNIARKGLMVLDKISEGSEDLYITHDEWREYSQK